MGWSGLQEGKKKALRRVPHRYFDYTVNCGKEKMEEYYQKSLVRARKTTKRCSAAIHGCGHRRDVEGRPTIQEQRALLDEVENV